MESYGKILSYCLALTRTWFLSPTCPAMISRATSPQEISTPLITLPLQKFNALFNHRKRKSRRQLYRHRERKANFTIIRQLGNLSIRNALAVISRPRPRSVFSHGEAITWQCRGAQRLDGGDVLVRGWRRRHRRRRRCSTERRAGVGRFRVASPVSSRLRLCTAIAYIAIDVLCTYAWRIVRETVHACVRAYALRILGKV